MNAELPPIASVPEQHNVAAPAARRRRFASLGVVAAVAVAGGVVGSAVTARSSTSATAPPTSIRPNSTRAVPLVSVDTKAPSSSRLSAPLSNVADLIGRALPSVVDISVEMNDGNSGTGSGFVISTDGRIVTNAHVVADATKITVTFSDKKTAEGTVVGVDRLDDLAVIKVNRTGLPALELGSSAGLRMGDPVVAIGSALALTGGPTATEGIVSALDRTIDTADGEHLAHLLQTDAAINPGNSGGPLLTLDGKVVGINSAGSSGAQNIGFAIAVDTAKPIVGQLAKGEKVSRTFLGVTTTPVNAEVAQQNGLSATHGLLIADVSAGSAAEQAGLRAGDVIESANGTPTDTSSSLGDLIQSAPAGTKLTLRINRNGVVTTHVATLGTRAV